MAVATTLAVLTRPFPTISWALAVGFGVIAGLLQARSIALAPDSFRSARTALEVRAALTSTTRGKQALVVQWVLLPVLLGVAFYIRNPLGGGLGGYAVFMFVRDLVALKAVISLGSSGGD